jgi:hypothetical protein
MAFVTGSCVFGYFDNDVDFQVDADKMVDFVRKKLGDPVMATHISSSQIYASFEEACSEYSAIVNSYQAKSVLTQFLGSSTGSMSGSENTYPQRLLEFQKKMAEPYGEAAGVGGSTPIHSSSIQLQAGVQQYNLQEMLSGSGALTGSNANTRIRVDKIFHFSPLSAYRFFGTTSAINYLHNQFSFESFTPETIFYMLPIWEDILRGMQFETSNRVRRSNYSYEVRNNVLTLYPAPSQNNTLYLTYTLPPDLGSPSGQGSGNSKTHNGVSNLSNIPFGNIQYSKLNSISKNWIRRMTFALAKEVEGQIRGKFTGLPIPNGDLNLNGAELISDARVEADSLRTELKELLDATTYDKLMEQEAMMAESLQRTIKEIPLLIYVG